MPEHTIKRTQEELVALMRERFGDDVNAWAFICPSCGDVATVADMRDALAQNPLSEAGGSTPDPTRYIGQACIGRLLGALQEKRQSDWKGRGCDWAAFGLFQGPEFVVMPDGKEVPSFAPAPAPEEVSA
ncbi:hypothetical protein QDA04_gp68 [Microbacterium phage Megan]|uniref:Uncharacterized protein n=1 Tax=Microbacterium phage Megan TaxID=2656551 RepID=A0A649VK90_9CAUD|nr:hypothetical protein QDA04_gp68 [Microbacterium phage Megan]QGJ92738.1 hypothetical protein PBI_MEGAN_68 [Microbacterium phage Megan]